MNIVKQVLTIGAGTFLNILISVLTTPIITRIVDPNEYGMLTIFNTYVGMIASFCYLGLNDALLRFFFDYETKQEKKGLLKLCITIPIIISFVTSVISVYLFKIGVLKSKFTNIALFLLCLNVIFSVWNYISMEMLQNLKKSNQYSLTIVSQKITYCVSAISLLLVFKKEYFFILALSTTLSTLVSAILSTYFSKEYWNFKNISYPKNIDVIIKYAIPISIYFVIYSIYDTVTTLMVENACSEYDVGIFGSAFSLVGMFAIIQTAFTIMWRPIQTEHYTLYPNDTSILSKGNRYITVIMLFVGINVIMFKDVLCLFLGEKYRSAAQIIPFLIFNPIINTMISTVTSGIEKAKKSSSRALIIIVSIMVLYSLNSLLLPLIGARGAGISITVSLVVQYYLTVMFSNKYYYVDYGVRKSIIAILTVCGFATYVTFKSFSIIYLGLYVLCMIVFVVVYYKDIKEMVTMALSQIKHR